MNRICRKDYHTYSDEMSMCGNGAAEAWREDRDGKRRNVVPSCTTDGKA